MDYDAEGNPRLHYPGDYNILVPGHRDLDVRERVLDEHGVTHQVLTFTTPGVHYEEPAVAVRLARLVNERFATEGSRRKPYTPLATLPLNDPRASSRPARVEAPGAAVPASGRAVRGAGRRRSPVSTRQRCVRDRGVSPKALHGAGDASPQRPSSLGR